MADRETIIRRVRGIRAQADSTTYPKEREEYQRKASSLISAYDITEAELADPVDFGLLGRLEDLFKVDPAEQEVRVRRRELWRIIDEALYECIEDTNKLGVEGRVAQFEHLRKHLMNRIDYGLTVDGKSSKGVLYERDKAIEELFYENCAYVMRNAGHYRHPWHDDDDWREIVKSEAERMTSTYNIQVRTVQAALRRVNGYKRFHTVLFPKKKEQAS